MTGRRWHVERVQGEAGALHARGVPASPRPTIEVLAVPGPALVLGSTQPASVADVARCEAAGVAVVRRMSGGGAVLVAPGDVVWVDVVLPAGHALWSDDVSSSAWWLGEAWVRALAACGATDAQVHRGSLCLNRWGRLVCFAGLGGGEVTRGPGGGGGGGGKAVGIAQRRTRSGARFQCAVPLAWRPEDLVGLLSWASPEERAGAAADLATPGLVVPFDAGRAADLLAAFVAAVADAG